jgi:hypothetical protein
MYNDYGREYKILWKIKWSCLCPCVIKGPNSQIFRSSCPLLIKIPMENQNVKFEDFLGKKFHRFLIFFSSKFNCKHLICKI